MDKKERDLGFYFIKTMIAEKGAKNTYRNGSGAINVFGNEAEPICDYLSCHHKFSNHGKNKQKCRCKHPQNRILGLEK